MTMRLQTDASRELQGYIDTTGTLVIPCKYEKALAFSEGLAAVKVTDHWGFINAAGVEVIQPEYEEVSKFSEGLAVVKLDGKTASLMLQAKWLSHRNFPGHAGFLILQTDWHPSTRQKMAEVDTSINQGRGLYRSITIMFPHSQRDSPWCSQQGIQNMDI